MSAWTVPLTGHCFCNASSYTLDPSVPVPAAEIDIYETAFSWRRPYITFLDHCASCRRSTSSLYTAWLIVPSSFLTFAPGSPVKTYRSSSGNVERRFCGECGTTLTYWARDRAQKMADCTDVTIATLCEADLARLPSIEGMQPKEHMWWDYGIGWVKQEILDRTKGEIVAYKDGNHCEASRVDFAKGLEG